MRTKKNYTNKYNEGEEVWVDMSLELPLEYLQGYTSYEGAFEHCEAVYNIPMNSNMKTGVISSFRMYGNSYVYCIKVNGKIHKFLEKYIESLTRVREEYLYKLTNLRKHLEKAIELEDYQLAKEINLNYQYLASRADKEIMECVAVNYQIEGGYNET